MQFRIVTLSSALPVSDSLWSAVTNHQPAFFLPPWWIRGRWPPLRHLFPHAAANPFLVGPCARYASGQLAISARVSGAGWAGQWPVWNICWGRHIQPWRMLTWLLQRRDPAGGGEKKGWRKGGSSPSPGVTGKGWAERVILCQARPGSSLFLSDPISGWGSPPRQWGQLARTLQLLDSSSSFLCCSTGTNDFSPLCSALRFSGYCLCLLVSPSRSYLQLAPGVRPGQAAGDRSRGVAGGVLTAPRGSSAGAAQSWHPAWAVCCHKPGCHTSCHHTELGPGPGMPHVTCQQYSQISLECVLVFSMSSSSSHWRSVFWLALSSHVSQCHVTWLHCDESFLSFFKLFPPASSLNLSIRCPLPSAARPERRESQKFLFPLADTWLDPPTCDQALLLGSNLTPASSLSNPCVTFALRVVPGQWTVAADSEC